MPQSLHSCENLPHIWQHRPAQSSSSVTQAEVTLLSPRVTQESTSSRCTGQTCACASVYNVIVIIEHAILTMVVKDSQYLGLRIVPATSSLLSAVRVIILKVTQRKPWLLLSFMLPALHHLSCTGIPASPRSSAH